MVGGPVAGAALLESIVPLPAAALLEPSPLLLPGLRLLPAALWLLLCLREDRTLLSLGLLPLLLLLLLLLLGTLLRRLSTLLRRLLGALRLWLSLLYALVLLWLLGTLRLGCLLSALWLRLGLLRALLLLWLLRMLLLCGLSALLRLPPLILSSFFVVLCVSRHDQSGKQEECCGTGYTGESHFVKAPIAASHRHVECQAGHNMSEKPRSSMVPAVH